MGNLLRDLRFAARNLRRSPGVFLVIVASLALGIGAVTTAYSWIDSFLLRPFPAVERSDRLVSVYTKGPQGAEWSLSYPRYRKIRDQIKSFDGMLVHALWALSLKQGEQAPERVWGQLVSANFFDVLGVHAALGRTFHPDEEANAAPVVVLSQSYWQRRFNSDPSVVGQTVLINGQGFAVVGVAPSGFGGAEIGLGFDLWVPVTTVDVISPGSRTLTDDGNQWLVGMARLKRGVSFAKAASELDLVTSQISKELGDKPLAPAGLRRLSEGPVGRMLGPLFITLLGLGAVVLLVACANVANLLVAQAVGRTREMSVRLAIGAGRVRILRQLLTESLILAAIGGGFGFLFALAGRDALRAAMPPLPYPVSLRGELNWRVILVAVGTTMATAIIFGLLPALHASRPALLPALKDDQVPRSGKNLLRSGLVITQVAFALIALVSAGLFVRSAAKARAADPGFTNADHVLVAETDLHLAGIGDSAGPAVRDRLLREIAAVPGVTVASLTTDIPMLIGGHSSNGITLDGYTPSKDENMSIERGSVGPGYFEAMAIPIRAGRGIDQSDRADAAPVIVVNDAFAKRFWSGQEAVGRRVNVGGRWRSVVGVVGNVKMETIGEAPYAYMYLPHTQWFESNFTLVIATSVTPMSVAEPIRKAIAAVNSNLPMLDARSMRQSMEGALFIQATGATLLTALGGVALALAAIGLFAVLSYVVGLRRREIGIRMALGAEQTRVVGLVVSQASRLVGIGLAVGGTLAFLVARLLRSQLYAVSPGDPITYGSIAVLVVLVGVAASLIPARRAARVDPVRVLRAE